MKVQLHSAQPRLGDVAGNVRAVVEAIGRKEADLVVFPEMFLSGYNIGDDAQRLAFRDDDPRLAPLLRAAKDADAHVVVGAPRTPRRGVVHNSALLVRPDGTVDAYDKRCLATFTTFEEGLFYKPGTTSPVWETDLGAIGIGICYDLFFPEFQRRQVLAGADLLLNISASPATSQRFFEPLLLARSIENASFVGYSNCVGPQDGIVFWGGAQAFGPRGQQLARMTPFHPGSVTVDVDLDDVRVAREFRPTIRDGAFPDIDEADAAREASESGQAARGRSNPPTAKSSSGPASKPTQSAATMPHPAATPRRT